MRKSWLVIPLLLLIVSGCGSADTNVEKSDANSSQTLSDEQKIQKIADNLGYDRIEIEDTDPEHTFRWGVKAVESKQVPGIIKDVWSDLVGFEVLQYDDLDESYQLTSETINISITESVDPQSFINACEILLSTVLHDSEFDKYSSVTIHTEYSPGVVTLTKEKDGTYSTCCIASDEIKAIYDANVFFSSLDSTKKLQEDYASLLEDDSSAIFWYLSNDIPGTWICLESDSNLSQIDFILDERTVLFTYKDQEKREFYWSDYTIQNNVASVEILDDDGFSNFFLRIEPTQNTLTKDELLINSSLFRKE